MRVSELFDIYQGNGLELINMEVDTVSDINFVARTAENNGVVASVKPINKKTFPAGVITVAVGGSVLSSFVQDKPFYTGFHVLVLYPKQEMTLEEKLFYCHAIKMNAYRYSYGRQANRTLKDINLPPLPDWIKNYKIDFSKIQTKVKRTNQEIDTSAWHAFKLSDLFDIELSKGDLKKDDLVDNGTILVSATTQNNGVIGYVSPASENPAKPFSGNKMTTDMFCSAFYQDKEFYAVSHGRINIMTPKFTLNKYIGLFIATIINKEQYRFAYGRAVYSGVLSNLQIKLPADKDGNPDWAYMENYIKSLPFSDLI